MSNEEIIKTELEKVVEDAVKLYRASGKKTSGNWEKGNRIEMSENKGELYGFAYLAGRGATKQGGSGETLQSKILTWLKTKGIKPLEEKMKLTSLAFLIARKIHREGTNKKYHLQVWEQVLTPKRIQDIIDKVSTFNVSFFTGEVEIALKKLTKNI
ncbi:hypothetical protein Phi46:1_gp18 [Cellulophaga phage phi46:1]|uniref:hypothetical protein n=1 Tax=Cellulophaga phage phi46:1 TaxID=1327974 RepID=UPI000351CBA6|nr:hypothetical protein Phi46:1_gp18 [Cellulophaga phage phi46:1]AGO47829.1 hypothetical protein Phi46:1_gp18 [Cellulophaga phage phi46:1]